MVKNTTGEKVRNLSFHVESYYVNQKELSTDFHMWITPVDKPVKIVDKFRFSTGKFLKFYFPQVICFPKVIHSPRICGFLTPCYVTASKDFISDENRRKNLIHRQIVLSRRWLSPESSKNFVKNIQTSILYHFRPAGNT